MSACARCGTALAGPRCPACGALASLAVDGPGEGAPAVLPPSTVAPPPPGYAYPPPGYGYPPMPYGYPPPGYAYPPPRPGIGALAILVIVANCIGAAFAGLFAVVAKVDGPTDDAARIVVIAICLLAFAAWLAGAIGLNRARAWGAIMSLVTWVAIAVLFGVTGALTESPDKDALYGIITIIVGSLTVALLAGLSLPQLKRRREWRAS